MIINTETTLCLHAKEAQQPEMTGLDNSQSLHHTASRPAYNDNVLHIHEKNFFFQKRKGACMIKGLLLLYGCLIIAIREFLKPTQTDSL